MQILLLLLLLHQLPAQLIGNRENLSGTMVFGPMLGRQHSGLRIDNGLGVFLVLVNMDGACSLRFVDGVDMRFDCLVSHSLTVVDSMIKVDLCVLSVLNRFQISVREQGPRISLFLG